MFWKPKTHAEKAVEAEKLWIQKEKVYVDHPTSFRCPDKSHPLFTIHVTIDKPVAVCYYCSKTWVLNNGNSRT